MHRIHAGVASAGLTVLWLGLSGAPVVAQQPPTKSTEAAADNTKVNRAGEISAGSQKNGKRDLAITRDVRRAIVADKSLSTYAHNVKVITENGFVTIKGPVRSDEERKTVEAKAVEVAGRDHVANELTIAPAKNK
jgi:hyperosmotically inducible periplasmic protein